MLDEDEARDLNVAGGDADNERRLRREIANSNERRRMQSINAGFQSLRTLLPHHEGEKLSKAAILQQTAEYIYQLEQEKTRLLSQNSQLKRLYSLSQQGLNQNSNHDQDSTTSPRLKKKKIAIESSTTTTSNTTTELLKEDEYPQGSSTSTTPSVAELSMQLLNEQRLRMRLEERLKTLEQNATTPILPTQPLKMEVVNATATVATASASAAAQPVNTPSTESTRPTAVAPVVAPPTAVVPTSATILLAEKNIRVEVEAAPPKETAVPKEELKVTGTVAGGPAQHVVPTTVLQAATALPAVVTPVSTQQPASTRSFIVTTASASNAAAAAAAAAPSARQNLDSIVEAIRHLEGDHLFSEDSHKVVKEEIVEYTTPLAPPPTAASLSHHVTVTKNLVPSKINPIPATLLPKQPHPAVLQPHPQPHPKEKSNSIIIVKQCQT